MTLTVEDLLATDDGPIDFTRDRWGRPLIVPAGGTKAKPYQRASSAAKPIEDTFNLEMWARRNVAFGLAHDTSLVARVLAVGGTPSTWNDTDRKAVAKVVEDAAAIAQAHKAADIGTAVHKLTEKADAGEPVTAGPYQADLDAYRRTIDAAGIEMRPEWIECRMACDVLELAGTADRIVTINGEHYVFDLKTGRSIDFGGLSFAAQLAAYAHSDLYNPADDTRLDTPELSWERGIICHLPAGTGTCTLHWVDLAAGYTAAVLANEVRTTRKASKGWLKPVEIDLAPALEVTVESAALRVRLAAAIEAGARHMTWPAGVAKFKDGGPMTWAQVLEVERCVLDAEREAEMPFALKLPEQPNQPAESETST